MGALGGTALVFFCCSAYVLGPLSPARTCLSLGGMLRRRVALIGMVANIFLQLLPCTWRLARCLSCCHPAILYETSNIIHGGETNYIRAHREPVCVAVQHLRQPAEHPWASPAGIKPECCVPSRLCGALFFGTAAVFD